MKPVVTERAFATAIIALAALLIAGRCATFPNANAIFVEAGRYDIGGTQNEIAKVIRRLLNRLSHRYQQTESVGLRTTTITLAYYSQPVPKGQRVLRRGTCQVTILPQTDHRFRQWVVVSYSVQERGKGEDPSHWQDAPEIMYGEQITVVATSGAQDPCLALRNLLSSLEQ